MHNTEVVSVDEARALVLAHSYQTSYEYIRLEESLGRVLFSTQTSPEAVPPFATSLMDGFALASKDAQNVSKSSPLSLGVVGHIGAGMVFDGSLRAGQCVRIMTGCALPEGTDSVIKLEDTAISTGTGGKGSVISYGYPIKPGQFVKAKGAEVEVGDVLVEGGQVIDAHCIGALSSLGFSEISVFQKPKVAIIPLGSELVETSHTPKMGQIRNSNRYTLSALAQKAGAEVIPFDIIPDDRGAIAETILRATELADIVVTSGGSAGGDFDFIDYVIKDLGELLYTDVLMNPAKTQGFGIVKGVPVFGLPGQPTAAMMAFEVLVRPAIRKCGGFAKIYRTRVDARLDCPVKYGRRTNHLPHYQYAHAYYDGQMNLWVKPLRQGGSLYNALDGVNGFVLMPPSEDELQISQLIDFYSFVIM